MIERGSGVTTDFGGTNWSLHDLPTMWAILCDHDTENHWRHVAGWRRTYELMLMHLTRLMQYRDQVIEAWPPERSPAAREYVDRLTYLIDTLQKTHGAAAANYTTFSAATTAIGATRRKLRELYDEYVAKKEQKQAYDEALLAAESGKRVMPFPDRVTDVDLEVLNNRGRELMTGLSGELRLAQAQLKPPPTYKPNMHKAPNDPDVYGESAPPIIPPIVPAPLTGPEQARMSYARPAGQYAVSPDAFGVGPILVGSSTLPSAAAPSVNAPAPSSSGFNTGIGTPAPDALPPSLRSPFKVGPAAPFSLKQGVKRPIAPLRGLPSGTVIGQTPEAGPTRPAPSGPVRRVNPVGGVIGGAPAGPAQPVSAAQRSPVGRRTYSTPSGTVSSLPPNTPGYEKQRGMDAGRQWDPDDPWATAQGVDPIVLPPTEPERIDPGPAIGMHR